MSPTHAPRAMRSDWRTPRPVFDQLNAEFDFDLDAAAAADNALCSEYFDESRDALVQDWGAHTVWCNPPYGDASLRRWMRKAWEASRAGATVVCLVPANTSARWWHEWALRGEIRFFRGRLRFGGAAHAAPFPSAAVIFRPPLSSMGRVGA